MKNLKKLYEECKQMVLDCGISMPYPITEVTVNIRAKGRFGQCRYVSQNGFVKSCKINISSEILKDESNVNAVKSTIIHEILHAANPYEGHKGQWKRDALKIMKRYPEITISRIGSYEKFGLESSEPFAVQCKRCKVTYPRRKKTKVIMHPEWYKCSLCGGNLERIK